MIGTMASANIGATPARRSERKPDHMPLPLYAIFLAGKLTGRFLNSVSPEQELLVKLNHPGRCDTQMSCDASCARNVPPSDAIAGNYGQSMRIGPVFRSERLQSCPNAPGLGK